MIFYVKKELKPRPKPPQKAFERKSASRVSAVRNDLKAAVFQQVSCHIVSIYYLITAANDDGNFLAVNIRKLAEQLNERAYFADISESWKMQKRHKARIHKHGRKSEPHRHHGGIKSAET